ncbi:DNA polymerase alpha/epsilon subunit B-domain-containing protein [Lenzites betulinus]|nr:DNA polymerase alpha/epsilon subunit B-domain-containing protein [Lenzites betulinus]
MAIVEKMSAPSAPLTRPSTTILPVAEDASFSIKSADKSYKHQYSNIYFVRLRALRQHVEQRAKGRWNEVAGNPVFVPRVLDVEKGQLCFIIGTVYMDMPLKPNVLEDVARDRSIPAPPPRDKFYSDEDSVMLEDESGRICLVGDRIRSACLVTGVILGALGIETHNGDFEVVDICYPGMAPQPSAGIPWPALPEVKDAMEVDGIDKHFPSSSDEWIALVSGLEIGSANTSDGQIQLLAEFLTAEVSGPQEQSQAARISRLIIAGNSLGALTDNASATHGESERKARRYGNDASSFTPHPTQNLAAHLTDVCRSIPVHLLPGPSDPAATILPQQPLPRAMFGGASHHATFSCESNPAYIHLAPSDPSAPSTSRASQPGASGSKNKTNGASPARQGNPGPSRTVLVHSGQPVDDMFKYVPTPPISRLTLAEATLRWRHMAPTAPDTLWCHPYFARDPFVFTHTPDVYVVGNQPAFATKLVEDDEQDKDKDAETRKRCRIVLLPSFKDSGVLVLVNLRTLAVKKVQFAVEDMSAGGGET